MDIVHIETFSFLCYAQVLCVSSSYQYTLHQQYYFPHPLQHHNRQTRCEAHCKHTNRFSEFSRRKQSNMGARSNLKSSNPGFHVVGGAFQPNNLGNYGKLRSRGSQTLLGHCNARPCGRPRGHQGHLYHNSACLWTELSVQVACKPHGTICSMTFTIKGRTGL